MIEGLHGFLADGDVVVATDYSGMGASGPPSYLIGTTEGRNVLDSVRAARTITAAHASDRVLLWGHSQGGQAALFAAQTAKRYAPDLRIIGVAVAAPAVELGALLRDDIGDFLGVGLGAYAFSAYRQVYASDTRPVRLTTLLTPQGAAATPRIAKTCSFPLPTALRKLSQPLVGRFLAREPDRVEPWRTWLRKNVPASHGIGVPILVAQGENDKLVRVATTNAYVRALCGHHERVAYDTMAHASHALVGFKARSRVRSWFADLVAGRPVRTTCN